MHQIIPHLWYDTQAKQATELYTSSFTDVFGTSRGLSKITNVTTIENTPSGNANIVNFRLLGQQFMAISAGPLFKFNPSISFLVACKTKKEVDALHARLSNGGSTLMELGSYPFSERYCWIADKFGLSWQIMHMGERIISQNITPTFMFVGNNCGKAEEAINYYMSVFHKAKIVNIMRYEKGEEPDKAGTIKHAEFTLEGYGFAAMDSAHLHKFTFTEAVSFIVHCDTQKEIDYYWGALSYVPEAEQCGWLKDKYGVSWQIVPTEMEEMMNQKNKEKMNRVTQAFLAMKKFDIATLKKAAEG